MTKIFTRRIKTFGRHHGVLSTLFAFNGGSDSGTLFADLIQGTDGNFFGATSAGGNESVGSNGPGSAFLLSAGIIARTQIQTTDSCFGVQNSQF